MKRTKFLKISAGAVSASAAGLLGAASDATAAPLLATAPVSVNIPPGALTAWTAAKAVASRQQVNVCVIGDSITQGLYASSWTHTSWFGLLKTALQSKYGDAGSYTGPAESIAFTLKAIPPQDAQWTLTGAGWGAYNMIGPTAGGRVTAGDRCTFSSLAPFRDFDLHVTQNPNGVPLKVTVDGAVQPGAPTMFNAAWRRHVVFPYSGFPHARHTVDVVCAASGYASMGGITYYPKGRAAPGIVVNKLARSAYTSGLFLAPFPTLQPDYQPAKAMVEDFGPRLVIISLGINDCSDAVGFDLYKYNLAQACQSARNAGASIVLLMPARTSASLNNDNWPNYLTAAREVADAFTGAFVNIHAYWGNHAAGYLSKDAVHPNDAGHASIAGLLLGFL